MDKKDLAQAARAMMVFAGLSFVTALGFNMSTGDSISEVLPPKGGIVGPVLVESDRTVYEISVSQPVPDGASNHVEGAVLDANKKHLFSFGEEFWQESGYDSEGAWTERKTAYDIKVTLQKGTYYLGFESENPRIPSRIGIVVSKKGGSAIPFVTAGIIALIVALILNAKAAAPVPRGFGGLNDPY